MADRIAVLDGYTLNPGDISWAALEQLGVQSYDLVLMPTLPVAAFAAGDDQPGQVNGVPTTYLGWTAFTYPFNATGQPAATLPCGFTSEGLPVGLQVVGKWRQDATVLRACAAFEELQPWRDTLPPL